MQAKDSFVFEILEDGTISINSESFGDNATHKSADELLDEIHAILGGERKKDKRPGAPKHFHHHDHKTGQQHSH